MKWMLAGKTGLLGSDATECLAAQCHEILELNRSTLKNAESPREIIHFMAAQRFVDFVFNATGYTAVDTAETEKDQASLVNSAYPEKLAAAAKEVGTRFIHI